MFKPDSEPIAPLHADSERVPRQSRRLYVQLHLKLALVVGIALAWAGVSLWLALPWIAELGDSITMPLAIAATRRSCSVPRVGGNASLGCI